MNKKEKETTKKNLILAGIRIFAEKGYRDATVRQICHRAGSSNINAVNYYFGSKEGLYKHILEMVFAEYDKQKPKDFSSKSPEEKLKSFITIFCIMLYKEQKETGDMTKIFISEMMAPSPFLEEMVDTFNRPRVKMHLQMIREILGENAPESMVRDCLISISGQILYYSFAWPVFSRLFPDYTVKNRYQAWANHVYKFSMGGIAACKRKLDLKEYKK